MTDMPPPAKRQIPYTKRWSSVVIAEIQIYCYEQKLQGHTVREIAVMAAEKFNRPISKTRVGDMLLKEIKERVDPLAEQFRQVELDKLEKLELRLNKQLDRAADQEDPTKVATLANALVRVFERRARYQGADAPTQFSSELTVHYTVEGVDLEDLK